MRLLGITLALLGAGTLAAQGPFTDTAHEVNTRLVKLFGAGGFKGLPSYGSGVMVSAKGHILTANNHLLATQDLRVHLYDGRLYHAKIVAREPELDIALVKIEEEIDFLPHFDLDKAAARPKAKAGDWVLAFSNAFQIATRDEPMTVQHGVVAAVTDLRGRRGVFDAPYAGEVYFVDAISNNPGAAGGVVTTRKGELLGVIGRELKNTLSDTWVNYAVPVSAGIEIERADGKKEIVSIASFSREAIKGTYRPSEKKKREEKGGYHGIQLVVNAVGSTPPYVEEVAPNSPAAQAGLRPDDLIVYVDGELVSTINLFRDAMRHFAAGAEIRLQVQRGNRLESLKLKLSEAPQARAGGR